MVDDEHRGVDGTLPKHVSEQPFVSLYEVITVNLADALAMTPISSLDLSRYVTVAPADTVAETVAAMRDGERSCACVLDGNALIGVFTQRDVLHRAIGRPSNWSTAISDQMSGPLKTVGNGQSVSDAIEVMNRWWIRNLPVLGDDGSFVGNLSYWTVMQTITNLLASRIDASQLEPAVRDGLDFVDFTGLNLHPPVTINQTEPLEVAVHHLRNRGVSQMLAVDDRGHLVGTLAEFDLQMRVGCDIADLDSLTLADVMTAPPKAIAVRSPISQAISALVDNGNSNIALLAETQRPAGVASFRDITAYLESSIEALTPSA